MLSPTATQARITVRKTWKPLCRSSASPWRERFVRSCMVISAWNFSPRAARPMFRTWSISSVTPWRLKASTRVGMITSSLSSSAATVAAVKLGGQSMIT